MSQNMRHNRSFQAFHKCRGYFFIKSELIQNGYWSSFFSTKLDNNNHWFAEPRLYFQSTKILTPDFLRWLWECKRIALFNYENMIFPILCSYFCLNYLRQKNIQCWCMTILQVYLLWWWKRWQLISLFHSNNAMISYSIVFLCLPILTQTQWWQDSEIIKNITKHKLVFTLQIAHLGEIKVHFC